MRRRLAVVLAASVALACASCTRSAPDEPAAGPCPPASQAGAGTRGTLEVDGTERTYLVRTPSSSSAPAPLLIGLHGHGGSAAELEAHARLAERGAAAGSVVVLPDALGDPARWNFDRRPDGPDDFAFLDALIEQIEADHCIDAEQVTIVGSSNGAAFAGLAACERPGRFAAVVMVIATVPAVCPSGATPDVLTIRGTADRHVRFAGVPDLIADEAERADCQRGPVAERPAADVARTRYAGCRGGTEVVLDAVEGGTHRWPVAEGDRGYDATGAVLDFVNR